MNICCLIFESSSFIFEFGAVLICLECDEKGVKFFAFLFCKWPFKSLFFHQVDLNGILADVTFISHHFWIDYSISVLLKSTLQNLRNFETCIANWRTLFLSPLSITKVVQWRFFSTFDIGRRRRDEKDVPNKIWKLVNFMLFVGWLLLALL